jgi:hypothetical protein
MPSHFALFVLEGADRSGDGKILGAVRNGDTSLSVSVAGEGPAAAFASALRLGAHHIVGGYDHLMFLLALLLPAPLVALGGSWRGRRPMRETARILVTIVTAFTIGHSLTLVGATLGQLRLPAAPVEVTIAASVLVSAIHAYRPLLPGREAVVALLFGLIHGLAFATLVQEAGAGMASGAASLLGFNIGIELVQLAIVVAVAPSLLILSREPLYRPLRKALALLCACAAVAWIVNRTTGEGSGLVALMETALSHAAWLVVALAVGAAFALARRHIANASDRPLQPSARDQTWRST